MFLTNLKRILKSGFQGFARNSWLSTATILVTTLVLFVLGVLVLLSAISNTILVSLEEKVDISVYFIPDADEESIFAVKQEIETLPDVKEVTYVSKDAALSKFRERHAGSALISDALAELGDNPLQASLNIRAVDPTNYVSISDFLLDKNYPSVDKINYFENRLVIDRLSTIIGTVRGAGAFLVLFLAFVAVLVAFNTVRLAIYTMREEIRIMRLVGAPSWFIRSPFLVNGILYGAISATIVTILFLPISWIISPQILLVVPNFNLFQYFLNNFWEFFGILFSTGVALGIISSFIAIRRYLEA